MLAGQPTGDEQPARISSKVPVLEIMSAAMSIMLIVFVEVIAVQLLTIAELRAARRRLGKAEGTRRGGELL